VIQFSALTVRRSQCVRNGANAIVTLDTYPLNAITDVQGVEVGEVTLISGDGKLQVGKGSVRTGVTAILPRGKDSMSNPVFAGWWSLNGNDEMAGTTWVEESGFLEGSILITNTHRGGPSSGCDGESRAGVGFYD
jgi:L-aminopeptidase/D-esterase-like protein